MGFQRAAPASLDAVARLFNRREDGSPLYRQPGERRSAAPDSAAPDSAAKPVTPKAERPRGLWSESNRQGGGLAQAMRQQIGG